MAKKDSYYFPVFHVPHDGAEFPAELMSSICVPKELFLFYHERMRDIDVRKMVPIRWRNPAHSLIFPVSRLLCDVERFLGDGEPMVRYGMGFCYERVFDGRQIKNVTEELKKITLRYYRKHHSHLDSLCVLHPRILLMDLHSFSEEIVPREQLRPGVQTPDVCIGIDEQFTPDDLVTTTEYILRHAGLSTSRNYPYSGSIVPNTVLKGDADCTCASIMLEWNKESYCGSSGTPDPEKLARIRMTIEQIVVEYGKMKRIKKSTICGRRVFLKGVYYTSKVCAADEKQRGNMRRSKQ